MPRSKASSPSLVYRAPIWASRCWRAAGVLAALGASLAAFAFCRLTCCVLPHRHSSYGRLLDDHDYGSWGNYNNPLYDDS